MADLKKRHTDMSKATWTPNTQSLVVELPTATSADRIKVFVAFDRATLSRLNRARSTITIALCTRPTIARRRQATVGAIGPVAAVSVLSVVWARSVVVESVSTPTHWARLTIVVSSIRIPYAHSRVEHGSQIHAVLHTIAGHAHVHAGQIEASRCASSLHMIAHGEVAIAIGVASRWRNVSRIDNVRVDKSKLRFVSEQDRNDRTVLYLHPFQASRAIPGGASRRACARNADP
jgi:hypothetical protein